MPINSNNKVVCVNHPDLPMVRNTGFSAITKVDLTDVNFAFNPASGVPLVVYYCDVCGYVELYAAQKTSYWDKNKLGSTAAERGEKFEELIAEALGSPASPFGLGVISKRVTASYKGRVHEADIVVETDRAIFIFEVKTTTSINRLSLAAEQIIQFINIYYLNKESEINVPIFPIIVIPAENNAPNEIRGIPILRFDSERKVFTNGELVLQILRDKQGLGLEGWT